MRCALLAVALLIARPMPAYASLPPEDRGARVPTPTAAPAQLPPDLYRVTEVYVANVVTRVGDNTSYSTATQHQVTNTYARVLDQVGTGSRSAYDGAAFNGRAILSNGTPVAGTYYQNYIFDGTTYRPVSIVFFQDDSEVARRRAQRAPLPTPAPVVRLPAASPTALPAPRPVVPPATPRVTPAASVGPITIGVDPTGGGAVLDRVEVARGATYALRVNIRGAGTLLSWMVVAGVNDASNAPGWHDPNAPLAGQWLRLAPPAQPWTIALRARVATPAGVVERDGSIAVWVRSPAVVE